VAAAWEPAGVVGVEPGVEVEPARDRDGDMVLVPEPAAGLETVGARGRVAAQGPVEEQEPAPASVRLWALAAAARSNRRAGENRL
jgi:hypothetical protein